jgi:hypothetical protein
MSQSLMDRDDDRISGVLSCYDRMVITGTLPGVCYADGMTRYLYANGIRIFDYPQFAMELRDRALVHEKTGGCRRPLTLPQRRPLDASANA